MGILQHRHQTHRRISSRFEKKIPRFFFWKARILNGPAGERKKNSGQKNRDWKHPPIPAFVFLNFPEFSAASKPRKNEKSRKIPKSKWKIPRDAVFMATYGCTVGSFLWVLLDYEAWVYKSRLQIGKPETCNDPEWPKMWCDMTIRIISIVTKTRNQCLGVQWKHVIQGHIPCQRFQFSMLNTDWIHEIRFMGMWCPTPKKNSSWPGGDFIK